jgi:hypothetical protein
MSALFHETHKLVTGYPPGGGGSAEDFVSMKGYEHLTVVVLVDNGATVTGSTILFKQATVVAGTDEKALTWSNHWVNADTGASDALTLDATGAEVTDTTDAKNLMYVFEFDSTDLDVDNNFDCVRIDTTALTNAVMSVLYILGPAKYAKALGGPTAITD